MLDVMRWRFKVTKLKPHNEDKWGALTILQRHGYKKRLGWAT
jgi:hypothetical protein